MSGELKDTCIASRTVQQGDGSVVVVLPSKPAEDLGIDAGDDVVFTGEVGDSSLELQRADALLAKN